MMMMMLQMIEMMILALLLLLFDVVSCLFLPSTVGARVCVCVCLSI